jgi:hypothetical protein
MIIYLSVWIVSPIIFVTGIFSPWSGYAFKIQIRIQTPIEYVSNADPDPK